MQRQPPQIVAHRGASADRAEHTLGAYRLAVEQGADALECDVRLTGDGTLVCVHDRTVNRTSNGRGPVSTARAAHLSTLDFGSWHPGSVAGPAEERGLLTLAALLELVAESGVRLFVETKHPVRHGARVESALVAELARFGGAEVTMMSFSAAAVRRVRALAPAVPTVLLLNRLGADRLDGSLPPYADITGPGVHVLRADPGYVARARERGHDTYCWTVDDPADIRLCRDLGVRYVATNRPAATRAVLGS